MKNFKGYYRYVETTNPDVWFETSEVWEVKAADLTINPVYHVANGVVNLNKVADMYNAQKHNNVNNGDDSEDD
ncbi:hypothetical protein TanjilG_15885 [Lupinus angustifolius]|uniref:Uncharacterized protein n=1 Tax=Lupinus angustifolius TaxID=3871 RepID=A0A4P1RGV1_LUPAN|nr:hypothetical protein TanjilG_15885 [Lupinus angustifolius]